jgi:hypothetical protein
MLRAAHCCKNKTQATIESVSQTHLCLQHPLLLLVNVRLAHRIILSPLLLRQPREVRLTAVQLGRELDLDATTQLLQHGGLELLSGSCPRCRCWALLMLLLRVQLPGWCSRVLGSRRRVVPNVGPLLLLLLCGPWEGWRL